MKNLKAIKTYQPVKFENSHLSWFSLVQIQGKSNYNIEVTELGGSTFIRVHNTNDDVYIPLTNVASLHMFNKSDEDRVKYEKEEAKKPTGIKESEIKRPR